MHLTSGYPLKADAAGYCQFLWKNGNGRPWGDQHTSKGVQCAQLPAHGQDSDPKSFPRQWSDVKNRQRGEAWFFYPSADKNASCDCHCNTKGIPYMEGFLCQDMICNGPILPSRYTSDLPYVALCFWVGLLTDSVDKSILSSDGMADCVDNTLTDWVCLQTQLMMTVRRQMRRLTRSRGSLG
jgi:hypothetical protein